MGFNYLFSANNYNYIYKHAPKHICVCILNGQGIHRDFVECI